jgi:AraC-like DNA-binding protein
MTTTSSARRIAPVSTMIEPLERQRVDAAGIGLYRTIHRNSISEVLRDLKERRISAVLVSVGRCVREESSQMAAVVRAFPRIPTLALLSSAGDTNAESVLALGNCGIRTLIDVREPEGWSRLRALLGREATKDVDRVVIAALREDLRGVPDDCWRFFEALFSPEFRVSTVRQLARRLNVLPSTLMSRFFRAQLPAPKRYLASARLIRAARLFENPGLSISDVANHLNYSSPQSFGRHVRTLLHISAGEFRCTHDGDRMLERFRRELVLPNLSQLRHLRPLAVRPGMRLIPFPHALAASMQ